MTRRLSALFLLATSAAFAQTPASAPATNPADDPKSALRTLEKNMLAGDEKATFDSFVFADDHSRQTAHAIFDPQIAAARLQKALEAAFPNDPGLPHLIPPPAEIQSENDSLEAAPVSRTGNSAVITPAGGEKYTVVRQDGTWKVDFDATLKSVGDLPPAAELARAPKLVQAFDSVTADVNAKKFKSPTEALAALQSRTDALAPITPATQP
ncbi:MAG TPA: hypothetical protein VH253_01175 [Phycisphaerae bacterium]|nr:hypothetical protein [Phycisphaerae bacterium]